MFEVLRDEAMVVDEQVADVFLSHSFDKAVGLAVRLVRQDTLDQVLTYLREFEPSDDYEDVGMAVDLIENWMEKNR